VRKLTWRRAAATLLSALAIATVPGGVASGVASAPVDATSVRAATPACVQWCLPIIN
jgi:hypothetical protein